MTQLELFDDEIVEKYLAQDFVETKEMSFVVEFIEKFLANQDFDQKDIANIIIQGEKFSGKTHLVHFLRERFLANNLVKSNIFEIIDCNNVNLVNLFQKNGIYVVEDIDKINDDEKILNIINLARESKAFLIFSLERDLVTKIKDLKSRLQNFFVKVTIANPCDETLRQLVISYYSRFQRKVFKKDLNNLVKLSRNSYSGLFALL